MDEPLTLVSFDLCPFVQRAAIVLAEKNVLFTRLDVDLAKKPDWFTRISPLGKVPLLKVGDQVIFESAVIVEYLEERYSPALHPADLLEKARHRAWMEFASVVLGHVWRIETTADTDTFEAAVTAARQAFERVEDELGNTRYFAGSAFSIVDAVFAPVLRYFDTFDAITRLPILTDLPKISNWRNELRQRPSVRNAVAADYDRRLRKFLVDQAGLLGRLAAQAQAA